MSIETLKNLALDIQEVCTWAPDNDAIPEHDITQIMQSAMNMPTTLVEVHGKGLFMYVPHRQEGGITRFRDTVLRKHFGCNIDTTFNYCKTSIVFGICQAKDDSYDIEERLKASWHRYDDHQKQIALEKAWFDDIPNRLQQHGTPFGEQIPYFLKAQIMNYTMALSAAALECKRLGYHVQFFTLDRLAKYFYDEYPTVMNQPFIPMHCLNVGTVAGRVKMSHRRSRGHSWVKDTDPLIIADDISLDQELQYPFDKFRFTPNGHNPLRKTYKPI